jgi:hypothetical protein
MGTMAAKKAASQIGMISFRSGYANCGYTISPSEEKVTANERVGAGGAS